MTSALRYLSLSAKAGKLVAGGDEVEKQLRKGRWGMLILASDAGGNAARRGERLASEHGIKWMKTPYSKSEIAAAVGRGSSVALALVTDEGLAAAFAAAVNGMEQEDTI